MDWPGTADWYQAESADVKTLFNRVDGGRLCHISCDSLVNTPSCFFSGDTQRVRQRRLNSRAGSRPVEAHCTTEETFGIEITQHEIGVCHCWFFSALTIRRRSRLSARTLGANSQRPGEFRHMSY